MTEREMQATKSVEFSLESAERFLTSLLPRLDVTTLEFSQASIALSNVRHALSELRNAISGAVN